MLLGIIGSAFLLVSNTTNPPDAHTGAPGELFCANCHTTNGSSLAGTISVEGFPASITPDETYTLTVVNRNTNGGGVKAGFQMTILGPLNTKAGDMSMPSANSATSMLNGRQYFEHHPATSYTDSVVKWTVLWKAPALAEGSTITWYANGIIANGNVKETGDKTTSSKGTGTISVTATQDVTREALATIYPNPGYGVIHIELPDQMSPSGQVRFYDISGKMVSQTKLEEGVVETPDLPPGIYLMQFRYGDRSYVTRWSKI